MDLGPSPPFRSAEYLVRFASEPWEMRGAAALRHAVFCDEQNIFTQNDRDRVDDRATVLVAVSTVIGQPDVVVGTVRIHEAEPGVWWGSRLAVAPTHRRIHTLGPSLIRLAVASAHARGCHTFLAHIQSQNELLFRRMHWQRLAELDLHGRAHLFMQADLAFYPPIQNGVRGFVTRADNAETSMAA